MPGEHRPDAAPAPSKSGGSQELVAFALTGGPRMPIVPAPAGRAWMDETTARNAYRCLPMLLANQAGWWLLNPQRLTVTWNGGPARGDLIVELHGDDDGALLFPPTSHFGHGILSWSIPYVFRTPPGYNLLVRGPANLPKDGAAPLEGLVETDWNDGFFAMSWKITRPYVPILFERGEPICMLVPSRRGELDTFWPRLQPIGSDAEMAQRYAVWSESRRRHIEQRAQLDPSEKYRSWQSHYVRGVGRDDEAAEQHQTRLTLRPFAGLDRPEGGPGSQADDLPSTRGDASEQGDDSRA